MSTLVSSKPPTLAQRGPAAVARAGTALRLEDTKRLTAALAEIAADELSMNRDFAARVRARYAELGTRPPKVVSATTPRPSQKRTATPKPKVSDRRMPGERVDIVTPLDPRTLTQLYGAALPERLAAYSPKALVEMARMLTPGKGEKVPTQKSGAETLITYILRHVAS
jgi:hypothetical protein